MATRVIVISMNYKLKTSIAEELRKNKDYDVMSTALNVPQAANLFLKGQPNVLILDLENQMTNEVALKKLMDTIPVMIIIIGSHPGIAYIKCGIMDFVPKPAPIAPNVVQAFCANLSRRISAYLQHTSIPKTPTPMLSQADMMNAVGINQKIIAIASSTGGTDALPVVLKQMKPNCPPILIVQHMPSVFTRQFADRIDKFCAINIKEASNGEYLKKGTALVAPGDLHMRLIKKNQKLAVECFMADKMHGVRPAADIMYSSILNIIGGNVVGAILTGMGADGARGLLELKQKGAKVIAQDKDSCVVYGMPKAAVDLGAVDFILPLDKIGQKINELA